MTNTNKHRKFECEVLDSFEWYGDRYEKEPGRVYKKNGEFISAREYREANVARKEFIASHYGM